MKRHRVTTFSDMRHFRSVVVYAIRGALDLGSLLIPGSDRTMLDDTSVVRLIACAHFTSHSYLATTR